MIYLIEKLAIINGISEIIEFNCEFSGNDFRNYKSNNILSAKKVLIESQS